MEQGQFCFLTDEYFIIHDKEYKLMRNKESVDGKEHVRPCFYAFADKKNPLTQNISPLSVNMSAKYINRQTHEAVRIPQNTEREIIHYAEEVLRLVRSGNKHIVFSDIINKMLNEAWLI
jgi:hypothetical protein